LASISKIKYFIFIFGFYNEILYFLAILLLRNKKDPSNYLFLKKKLSVLF